MVKLDCHTCRPQNKGAITYKYKIDGSGEGKPFADLIKSYLTTGLKKVFIAAKTDDTYKQILNLNKLKSFNYAANLEEQIKKIMATLTDNNPSDLVANSFTTLTSDLNNLSDVVLQDHLYTAIQAYWQSFFAEVRTNRDAAYKRKFNSSFNIMPYAISAAIDILHRRNVRNPSKTRIDFTAFVKRDLGTVNMAAELKNYFQENNYGSHVYNNPKIPLKIVNERS